MTFSLKIETTQNIPSPTTDFDRGSESIVKKTSVSQVEVNVAEVAEKALASLALVFTNSFLTMTLAVTKLTGFAVLPSYAIGLATKSLHEANARLAKHAFTPFSEWTQLIGNEHKRIIQTDKVIDFTRDKILFYPEAYKKALRDSIKAVLAPVSLGLSITIAALWVAMKPLYVVFFVPGMLADVGLAGIAFLNKKIGQCTYSPMKNLADKMCAFQLKWARDCLISYDK